MTIDVVYLHLCLYPWVRDNRHHPYFDFQIDIHLFVLLYRGIDLECKCKKLSIEVFKLSSLTCIRLLLSILYANDRLKGNIGSRYTNAKWWQHDGL